MGLGLAALAFLAARRVRKRGGAPSMDEVRDTVDHVRSGEGFDIPIGETGSGSESEGETAAMGTETTQKTIGIDSMPGEDLSSGAGGDRSEEGGRESDSTEEGDTEEATTGETATEEAATEGSESSGDAVPPESIEGHTEEDAHSEPKEPGQMTVDEELAEDVVDEDAGETAADEAGSDGGESGEAGSDEAESGEAGSDETGAEQADDAESETGTADAEGGDADEGEDDEGGDESA